MKKWLIYLVTFGIVLIIGIILWFTKLSPEARYDYAKKQLYDNNYDVAIEKFKRLGDYADAKSRLEEALYYKAIELYDNEQCEEALEILKNIDYMKSKVYEERCKTILDYKSAIEIYDSGKYDEALTVFEHLNYMDSLQYAEKCNYEIGVELFDNRKYKEAVTYLVKSNDKKAYRFLNKCSQEEPQYVYEMAKKYYEKGDVEKALVLFENLKEYQDSEQYKRASALLKTGQGSWYADNLFLSVEIEGNVIRLYNFPDLYQEKYTLNYNPLVINGRMQQDFDLEPGVTVEITEDSVFFLSCKEAPCLAISLYSPDKIKEKRTKEKGADINTDTKPEIGMTKDQVLNTSWGKPNRINTTENAWGIHEQWCYSGQRYIYFDDGIVTTIQY